MYFDPDGNAGRLCLEIISCFAAESEKGGAEFIIVHLPGGKILSDYARTGVFIHARFLDCLDGCYNVVHPEKALADVVRKHSWETLIQHGHYSAPGDRIVGEAVADFIIKSRTD